MLTILTTKTSLKSLRETLAIAQFEVGHHNTTQFRDRTLRDLSALIADIDRQRPLGSNGKHGSNHTKLCQCEDINLNPDKDES